MTLMNEGVDSQHRETMPTFDSYLCRDRGKVPDVLFETSAEDLGNDPIPKDRYVSRDWHDREAKRLWRRVWQFACRENDIPDVGDRFAYDIVDQSCFVVRSAPGQVKAFANFCRHKGTRLVDGCFNMSEVKCSYHGWSWDLDGKLKNVPCRWDFPTVTDEEFGLLEIRAECWNGMVFVNFDPDAEPLSAFLDPVASHIAQWPADKMWKVIHIGKVVPCNWKMALEAFLEGYHVIQTHPNILPYASDCNAKYDSWGPHARMMAAMGVPSPHLGVIADQAVVDAMINDGFVNAFGDDGLEIPVVGPGQTTRDVLSDFMRNALLQQVGLDTSGVSDTEVLDTIQYFIFPNLVQFEGYAFPITYRFRPNGDDHRSCLWEVILALRLPEGVPPPRDVPLRMTPPEEPWAEVPELKAFGPGLDQDMFNILRFQRGVEQDGFQAVQLANYQERTARNLHRHLDAWLAEP